MIVNLAIRVILLLSPLLHQPVEVGADLLARLEPLLEEMEDLAVAVAVHLVPRRAVPETRHL
jgi:hypothetical protein